MFCSVYIDILPPTCLLLTAPNAYVCSLSIDFMLPSCESMAAAYNYWFVICLYDIRFIEIFDCAKTVALTIVYTPMHSLLTDTTPAIHQTVLAFIQFHHQCRSRSDILVGLVLLDGHNGRRPLYIVVLQCHGICILFTKSLWICLW